MRTQKKNLDPWGNDLPRGLTRKIEVFSSAGSREGHKPRLSRTCHWRQGCVCGRVSCCNRQWTTHFLLNSTVSGLFLLWCDTSRTWGSNAGGWPPNRRTDHRANSSFAHGNTTTHKYFFLTRATLALIVFSQYIEDKRLHTCPWYPPN